MQLSPTPTIYIMSKVFLYLQLFIALQVWQCGSAYGMLWNKHCFLNDSLHVIWPITSHLLLHWINARPRRSPAGGRVSLQHKAALSLLNSGRRTNSWNVGLRVTVSVRMLSGHTPETYQILSVTAATWNVKNNNAALKTLYGADKQMISSPTAYPHCLSSELTWVMPVIGFQAGNWIKIGQGHYKIWSATIFWTAYTINSNTGHQIILCNLEKWHYNNVIHNDNYLSSWQKLHNKTTVMSLQQYEAGVSSQLA